MLVTGTRKHLFIKTDSIVHFKQPVPTTVIAQSLCVCVACKDDRCYPDFYSVAFCVPLLCLALHSLSYTGVVLQFFKIRCDNDPGSLSNPQ